MGRPNVFDRNAEPVPLSSLPKVGRRYVIQQRTRNVAGGRWSPWKARGDDFTSDDLDTARSLLEVYPRSRDDVIRELRILDTAA